VPLADAVVAGIVAGYGIAIPVGAIAVLIVDLGSREGFRSGAAAGLGAATADGVYAAVAALFGAAVAAVLAPWATPLRWISVGALAGIAVVGVRRAFRTPAHAVADPPSLAGGDGVPTTDLRGHRGPSRTYAAFLGLTLLNPMTVTYFAALVLGLPALAGGAAERFAFAAAAFLASASWQLLLAAVGALLHRHASPGFRRWTSLAGNVVILGFAALIAVDVLASQG
jgi:arginine exporter protein ArgO